MQTRAAAVAHDAKRAEEQPWRHWYKSARWQRLRKQVLLDEPLCMCERCDGGRRRVLPSNTVDHKIPHRGDPVLFWDRDNLQGLYKRCHDRKTQRELRDEGTTHANFAAIGGGIGKSGGDRVRTVSGAREGMKTKS